MENLDLKCAEHGNKIAEIPGSTETLLTRSLGVLQEDGVYAFFLYVESRGKAEKVAAESISRNAFEFLKELNILTKNTNDVKRAIREEVASDLQKLLFAKGLLERTLIYARYHAKALDKGSTGGTE